MPKHDQFDKNQEEGWDPAELDITQILSEIEGYEELLLNSKFGTHVSAMKSWGRIRPPWIMME